MSRSTAPDDVEVLAVVQLDAQLVPDRPRRGQGDGGSTGPHNEGQVADEDRDAFTEAPGLAGPAALARGGRRTRVRGGRAAAAGGVVHHVVVEQGEGVHQLDRRARVDDHGGVGIATGTDEPQWQNAGRSRFPPARTSRSISPIDSSRSASNSAQPLGFRREQLRGVVPSTRSTIAAERRWRRNGGDHAARLGGLP